MGAPGKTNDEESTSDQSQLREILGAGGRRGHRHRHGIRREPTVHSKHLHGHGARKYFL